MLTDERKAEILRLVAQLPEGERVRAAVAMVVGWEARVNAESDQGWWVLFHRERSKVPWPSTHRAATEVDRPYSLHPLPPLRPCTAPTSLVWVPPYTTSLDAFMRDVEPWARSRELLLELTALEDEPKWCAYFDDNRGLPRHETGDFPALVCCLALLRAVGLGEVLNA